MPTARDFWSLAPAVLVLHVLALWCLQILLGSHTTPAPPHLVDVRLLTDVRLRSPQHRQADSGADFAVAARRTSRQRPHRRREAAQERRHADALQTLARTTPPGPAGLAQRAPQPRPANPAPSVQNPAAVPLRQPSAAIRSDSLDQVRQAPSEAPFPAADGASAAHPQRSIHPSTTAAMTPPSFGANYLHNPKPVYPALARRLGEEGTVVLQVRVSAGGLVDSVSVRHTSGYPQLDQAALAAVRQWTFTPASSAGRPVAGWVLVPILFSLDEPAG